jgi:hypothetical protein
MKYQKNINRKTHSAFWYLFLWMIGFSLVFFVQCTYTQGKGWATISASLDASYTLLEERALEENWQKLSSEYAISIERAMVFLETIEVLASSSGETSTIFNPANPPQGYTLCHGGHCHTEDGRLVDYEDIIADLSNSSDAQTTSIVSFPINRDIDLLQTYTDHLICDPSCEIGLNEITEVHLVFSGISIEGMVRDELSDPRITGEIPWQLHINFSDNPDSLSDIPDSFQKSISLSITRDGPSNVSLTTSLLFTAKPFDSVSWSTLDMVDGEYLLSPTANTIILNTILEQINKEVFKVY